MSEALVFQSIYCTHDGAEAVCLYAAGIPLHPNKQVENRYTPDWLARKGFLSATDAVAANRRGDVGWFFEGSDRQRKLSLAFIAQKKALLAAGSTKPTVNLPKLRDDDYAKMCAFLHVDRQFIENLWKSAIPIKAFPDNDGGCKVISPNSSDADKRRLGA